MYYIHLKKSQTYVFHQNHKKTILLLNKTDLPQVVSEDELTEYVDKDSIIKISALKNEGIEKVHEWMDPTYIIVPDVVGKTVKEATKELYRSG